MIKLAKCTRYVSAIGEPDAQVTEDAPLWVILDKPAVFGTASNSQIYYSVMAVHPFVRRVSLTSHDTWVEQCDPDEWPDEVCAAVAKWRLLQ